MRAGCRSLCATCGRRVFAVPTDLGGYMLQKHDTRSARERVAARRRGNYVDSWCRGRRTGEWDPADYEFPRAPDPPERPNLISLVGGRVPPLPSFFAWISDSPVRARIGTPLHDAVARKIDVGKIAETLRVKLQSQVDVMELTVRVEGPRLRFEVALVGARASHCADELDLPDGFAGRVEAIEVGSRAHLHIVRQTLWYTP